MKPGKLIVYAILVGILAGVVTLITNVLQGAGIIATGASLTFVTFVCWASYFLYGADPKGGINGWLSMIPGTICAIFIYLCVGWFAGAGMDVPYVALPLGVVVGVVLMCLCEKLPKGNNVAAVFVGAGLFFGIMGAPDASAKGYLLVAIGELLYAALGLFAGFLTVKISVAVQGNTTEN